MGWSATAQPSCRAAISWYRVKRHRRHQRRHALTCLISTRLPPLLPFKLRRHEPLLLGAILHCNLMPASPPPADASLLHTACWRSAQYRTLPAWRTHLGRTAAISRELRLGRTSAADCAAHTSSLTAAVTTPGRATGRRPGLAASSSQRANIWQDTMYCLDGRQRAGDFSVTAYLNCCFHCAALLAHNASSWGVSKAYMAPAMPYYRSNIIICFYSTKQPLCASRAYIKAHRTPAAARGTPLPSRLSHIPYRQYRAVASSHILSVLDINLLACINAACASG